MSLHVGCLCRCGMLIMLCGQRKRLLVGQHGRHVFGRVPLASLEATSGSRTWRCWTPAARLWTWRSWPGGGRSPRPTRRAGWHCGPGRRHGDAECRRAPGTLREHVDKRWPLHAACDVGSPTCTVALPTTARRMALLEAAKPKRCHDVRSTYSVSSMTDMARSRGAGTMAAAADCVVPVGLHRRHARATSQHTWGAGWGAPASRWCCWAPTWPAAPAWRRWTRAVERRGAVEEQLLDARAVDESVREADKAHAPRGAPQQQLAWVWGQRTERQALRARHHPRPTRWNALVRSCQHSTINMPCQHKQPTWRDMDLQCTT
jgi:hypothetical protein